MKTCSKCKQSKSIKDFYKHPKSADGLKSECKVCHYLAARRYADKTNGLSRRRSKWKLLGMDPDAAEAIWRTAGPCQLGCGSAGTHVDHDHQTGRVRGWLCDPCNFILGWVEAGRDPWPGTSWRLRADAYLFASTRNPVRLD